MNQHVKTWVGTVILVIVTVTALTLVSIAIR